MFVRLNDTSRLTAAGLPWSTYGRAQWAFRKRHENGLASAFARQGRNVLVNVPKALELLAQQTV